MTPLSKLKELAKKCKGASSTINLLDYIKLLEDVEKLEKSSPDSSELKNLKSYLEKYKSPYGKKTVSILKTELTWTTPPEDESTEELFDEDDE